MAQREIHALARGKRAEGSRFRLFGRRLLEKLLRESWELSALRKLMDNVNKNPSRSSIGEIQELGFLFRSLSPKERPLQLELEVFYCLSRARVCSRDPALRGVAEAERKITHWRIRESVQETFLNTS